MVQDLQKNKIQLGGFNWNNIWPPLDIQLWVQFMTILIIRYQSFYGLYFVWDSVLSLIVLLVIILGNQVFVFQSSRPKKAVKKTFFVLYYHVYYLIEYITYNFSLLLAYFGKKTVIFVWTVVLKKLVIPIVL